MKGEYKMKLKYLSDLHDLDWKVAHVTYKESNWSKPYSKKERTYRITSDAKHFDSSKLGKSLFGDCLDGIDLGVRLDMYNWEVESIEIIE